MVLLNLICDIEGGVKGEKEEPDGVRLCQRKDKL